MAIKTSLGKLDVPEPVGENLLRAGFAILDIKVAHIEAVRELPHHHGDPFDRMLIAQARVEQMTLMTADRHFSAYDVMTV
jgi:PIN domain nuclease of toxin-antitoxin system